MALLGNLRVIFQHLIDAAAYFRQRVHLEPQRLDSLEKLPLALVADTVDLARRMAEDVKRARGADARVELAQRPGRGVARIGKRRLARRDALLGATLESAPRQDHFAADFEKMRHAAVRRMHQAQWHAPDRADVLGHVLAIDSIAAGRSHD